MATKLTFMAGVLALIYFGFGEGVEGAANLAFLICWTVAGINFLGIVGVTMADEFDPKTARGAASDVVFAVPVALALGWYGQLLLGFAYAFLSLSFYGVVEGRLRKMAEGAR